MIKNIRKSVGLSQRDLAKLTGLSRTSIYDYENGRDIPEDKMDVIASALSGFIDMAYVAGLFDRRSSITITKIKTGTTNTQKSPHYVARIIFSSKHKLLCEILVQVFGVGNVSYSERSDFYHYYVACKDTEQVLEKLIPYLRLKRVQAEILLAFRQALMKFKKDKSLYQGKGRKRITPEQIEVYEKFYREIRDN